MNREVCVKFAKFGECMYGDDCTFMHCKPLKHIRNKKIILSDRKLDNVKNISLSAIVYRRFNNNIKYNLTKKASNNQVQKDPIKSSHYNTKSFIFHSDQSLKPTRFAHYYLNKYKNIRSLPNISRSNKVNLNHNNYILSDSHTREKSLRKNISKFPKLPINSNILKRNALIEINTEIDVKDRKIKNDRTHSKQSLISRSVLPSGKKTLLQNKILNTERNVTINGPNKMISKLAKINSPSLANVSCLIPSLDSMLDTLNEPLPSTSVTELTCQIPPKTKTGKVSKTPNLDSIKEAMKKRADLTEALKRQLLEHKQQQNHRSEAMVNNVDALGSEVEPHTTTITLEDLKKQRKHLLEELTKDEESKSPTHALENAQPRKPNFISSFKCVDPDKPKHDNSINNKRQHSSLKKESKQKSEMMPELNFIDEFSSLSEASELDMKIAIDKNKYDKMTNNDKNCKVIKTRLQSHKSISSDASSTFSNQVSRKNPQKKKIKNEGSSDIVFDGPKPIKNLRKRPRIEMDDVSGENVSDIQISYIKDKQMKNNKSTYLTSYVRRKCKKSKLCSNTDSTKIPRKQGSESDIEEGEYLSDKIDIESDNDTCNTTPNSLKNDQMEKNKSGRNLKRPNSLDDCGSQRSSPHHVLDSEILDANTQILFEREKVYPHLHSSTSSSQTDTFSKTSSPPLERNNTTKNDKKLKMANRPDHMNNHKSNVNTDTALKTSKDNNEYVTCGPTVSNDASKVFIQILAKANTINGNAQNTSNTNQDTNHTSKNEKDNTPSPNLENSKANNDVLNQSSILLRNLAKIGVSQNLTDAAIYQKIDNMLGKELSLPKLETVGDSKFFMDSVACVHAYKYEEYLKIHQPKEFYHDNFEKAQNYLINNLSNYVLTSASLNKFHNILLNNEK